VNAQNREVDEYPDSREEVNDSKNKPGEESPSHDHFEEVRKRLRVPEIRDNVMHAGNESTPCR
jgi:hypothetical protein